MKGNPFQIDKARDVTDEDIATEGQALLSETESPEGCYKLEIQHTTCRDVVIIEAASDTRKGLIFYAISSVFYALMAVCVKLAGLSGIPTWQIVFCRSVLIMSVSLTRLIRDGDNLLGDRRLLLCARGFFGFLSVSTLFFAVHLLPLADATVMTFLAPIFVAAISPLVLGESLADGLVLTMVVCALGVVLSVQPSFLFGSGRIALRAVVVGVVHPACSAAAKSIVRVLRTEKTNVCILYLTMFASAGSFLGMMLVPDQMAPIASVMAGLYLLGTGVFGYGTQYFMTRGLAHANAAQAMSMSYLGLVWGEAAGILLFHEYPNLISLCGTLLIVLATLWFGLKSLGKLPPWLLLGYAPPAAKEPVP